MRKIIFISFVIWIILLASGQNLFACSCQVSLEPLKVQVKEAFNNSTAIFSGEVASVTPKSEYEVAVKIKVGKSWKGAFFKEVTITTAKDSAMCGYGFEVGKTYLIYASGADDNLMTTNCSRTTIVSDKQDIKFLNKLNRRKVKSG